MTTALDLITDSLSQARIYAPGETISGADQALCLRVLNRMLDQWSNESLTCYAITEQSAPLQIGKSSYTVGVGGDFNVTRPLKVIDGYGAAYILDNLGNVFQVDVIPRDKWNLIGNRTTTSDIPDTMFYDPQFPLAKINIFPTPSQTYTLYWDSYLPFTQFSTLTSAVSLPPGYEEAILNNLTIRLKPHFKGAQIDPIIIELARESKANVKRTNIRKVEAIYDKEIVARGSGTYDIYRDTRGSTS